MPVGSEIGQSSSLATLVDSIAVLPNIVDVSVPDQLHSGAWFEELATKITYLFAEGTAFHWKVGVDPAVAVPAMGAIPFISTWAIVGGLGVAARFFLCPPFFAFSERKAERW